MEPSVESSLLSVIERICEATNRHDLDALANCFATDYDSAFPTHPDRAFGGREQMRRNWSRIFQAVPNIQSELLRWAATRTPSGRSGNGVERSPPARHSSSAASQSMEWSAMSRHGCGSTWNQSATMRLALTR